MAWDEKQQRVAIKAIGIVECNMDYGAVNPVDPISLSLFQWYAYNAAKLLNMLKKDGDWESCPAQIKADVEAHPESESSYWTGRYVDAAERQEIGAWLRKDKNRPVIDSLAHVDLESYVKAGEGAGINRETNSDTMAYFVNMYNQGPRYAFQVVANCGGNATLDEIHRACLANGVLGRYRSRYVQVYNIIKAHDDAGVGDGTGGSETDYGGDTSTGESSESGAIRMAYLRDNKLYVKLAHSTLTMYNTGQDTYKPASKVVTSGGGSGDAGTGTTGSVDMPKSEAQKKLVDWWHAHDSKYRYGNGPGRTNPDQSGYTDCSGTVRYSLLQCFGINPGNMTTDQSANGKFITNNIADLDAEHLEPGDCIYILWGPPYESGYGGPGKPYDHIEMYIGNGQLMGHGGPGIGPKVHSLANYIPLFKKIVVRRFI